MRKPKRISKMKTEAIYNRLGIMKALTKEYKEHVEDVHVSISIDNKKTNITSVSLPPIICCGNCHGCWCLCYDIRNTCYRGSVMKARAKNLAILEVDRDRYFKEIEDHIFMVRVFRWHDGGDIIDADYLQRIIDMAIRSPWCKMHIFTKMYDLVNNWCDENGVENFPSNLLLLFSAWPGESMENPYDFPVCYLLFPGEEDNVPPEEICTEASCLECWKHEKLCFKAKRGLNCKIYQPTH